MITPFNVTDFAALSPLLIILCGALALIVFSIFSTSATKKLSFFLTTLTFLLAIFATYDAPITNHPLLTPWIRFDALARFFTFLFLVIGLASTFLSYEFFEEFEASQPEYYFLLLSSVFGLLLIGSSADFLTLFLGIETLSISLYVWCGYMKKWTVSHEASLKYFLLGSLATAFFLYGIALIYGAIGTTKLSALLAGYQSLSSSSSAQILFLFGITLFTIGLGFKAALVPFHNWAPDVYHGSPTPVTAFMAVGTKAGAFAALSLVFLVSLPQFNALWNQGMAFLAYSTLIYANFVAMRQTQLRRFFAYSGISQAGFLLIPFVVGTPEALQSLLYYLIVYSFATMGCFAILSLIDKPKEGTTIYDLKGLFYQAPFSSFIFTLCLLTLAGLPPTVGFFAKFYLFKLAFEAGNYGLVFVGLSTTLLAVFYYLRIVAILIAENETKKAQFACSWPVQIVGLTSFLAIVVFSYYPETVFKALQSFLFY